MRLMPKPSLRDASCCIVAVVNAGLGRRRTVERATEATVKAASRIRRTAASAPARVSNRDPASGASSRRTGRAGSAPPPEPAATSACASTVQYARGANASISASRSHTSRSATDCTRPAERQPGTLRHSTGESPNPTR